MFDPRICYYGFLSWNNDWKDLFAKENVGGNLHPLDNVHLYYEKWVLRSKSEDFSMFQNLLEIVMIRSCSEAACESCGSLMGQHGGKNRHLEPENFSKEMVLREKNQNFLTLSARIRIRVQLCQHLKKSVKRSHIFLLISSFLIKISRFNCIL